MLDCWKTNPMERPSFKHLNEKFENVARDMTNEDSVVVLEIKCNVAESLEYPSYLKPI